METIQHQQLKRKAHSTPNWTNGILIYILFIIILHFGFYEDQEKNCLWRPHAAFGASAGEAITGLNWK